MCPCNFFVTFSTVENYSQANRIIGLRPQFGSSGSFEDRWIFLYDYRIRSFRCALHVDNQSSGTMLKQESIEDDVGDGGLDFS